MNFEKRTDNFLVFDKQQNLTTDKSQTNKIPIEVKYQICVVSFAFLQSQQFVEKQWPLL